ncbi:hypothetical protein E4U53_000813 [Claviceps sorghi]|nr:hypothetical protein E4U53_000813 [Claviceps sorghi]
MKSGAGQACDQVLVLVASNNFQNLHQIHESGPAMPPDAHQALHLKAQHLTYPVFSSFRFRSERNHHMGNVLEVAPTYLRNWRQMDAQEILANIESVFRRNNHWLREGYDGVF